LTLRPRTHQSNASRVHTIDVNRLTTIPTSSVTAKPLMGPVPYCARISPEMNVVMCPSMMAERTLSYPISTAVLGLLPLRISSRIRSLIRMFASIAMPIVSASPAMPGSVIAAPNVERTAIWMNRLKSTAKSATTPATW
jgi:hypothetical protein